MHSKLISFIFVRFLEAATAATYRCAIKCQMINAWRECQNGHSVKTNLFV